jgi:uncharacterized membrane protein SirB2
MIFFEPVCATTIGRWLRRTLVLLVLYSAIPKTTKTLRRKGAQRLKAFVSFVALCVVRGRFFQVTKITKENTKHTKLPQCYSVKDYLRMNER